MSNVTIWSVSKAARLLIHMMYHKGCSEIPEQHNPGNMGGAMRLGKRKTISKTKD